MRKPCHLFFLILPALLSCSKLSAVSVITQTYEPTVKGAPKPWFTGPLLAPGVETTPFGHIGLDTFSYFFTKTGAYDEKWKGHSLPNFHTALLSTYASTGITSFLDFGVQPQLFYQSTKGANSTQLGDLPFVFHFQLFKTTSNIKIPDIRLSLGASAPIGKYNNLNPKKLKTDSVGFGSWLPGITLSMGDIIQLSPKHFFSPKFAIGYIIPNSVSVNNLNTYGGGKGTHGTVYPGNLLWSDLSFEYSFTQNWAFAIDIFYIQENKTRFSGHTGFIAPGIPATVGSPSSIQLSLAPGLEYNWSQRFGLIGGVWFSAVGRNSSRFISGQLSFNIYL